MIGLITALIIGQVFDRQPHGSVVCTLLKNGEPDTHLVKRADLEQKGYQIDEERGLLIKKGEKNIC